MRPIPLVSITIVAFVAFSGCSDTSVESGLNADAPTPPTSAAFTEQTSGQPRHNSPTYSPAWISDYAIAASTDDIVVLCTDELFKEEWYILVINPRSREVRKIPNVDQGHDSAGIAVTADGHRCMIYSDQALVIELDTDVRREPQVTDFLMFGPVLSNDGRSISYFTDMSDSNESLAIHDLRDRETTVLKEGNARYAMGSHDGKSIFMIRDVERFGALAGEFWIFDVETRHESKIGYVPCVAWMLAISPDDAQIAYYCNDPSSVHILDLRAGATREVAHLNVNMGNVDCDWADGGLCYCAETNDPWDNDLTVYNPATETKKVIATGRFERPKWLSETEIVAIRRVENPPKEPNFPKELWLFDIKNNTKKCLVATQSR